MVDDGGIDNEADVVPLVLSLATCIGSSGTDAAECPDKAAIGDIYSSSGRLEEFSLDAAIGGIYSSSGKLEDFSIEAAIGGIYSSSGRPEDISLYHQA